MYAVQTRLVWCEDEQGDKKSFGDCDWKSQPVYARLCKAMCPEWQSGPWGQVRKNQSVFVLICCYLCLLVHFQLWWWLTKAARRMR